MKQKVIEFFQNLPKDKHEQFNKAFELYRNSEGKNHGAERILNVTGYSDQGLENLKYDLQKLHGITDAEKVYSVQSSVISKQDDEGGEIKSGEENKRGLVIKGKKGNRPDDSHPGEVIIDNPIAEVPMVPIREEFPFLNDADCPNDLKILVADKITAWKLYEETQKKLQNFDEEKEGSEALAKLSKIAVDAFTENQKIYEELNVYKETGKILGAHPIFKKLALQRAVDEMTNDQLIKFKNSSAKFFSVNKKDLTEAKTAKDTVKIDAIKKRVKERVEKLVLVNKKLGVK